MNYPNFLVTLNRHGLVLYSVEDDENHYLNQYVEHIRENHTKPSRDNKLSRRMAQRV